MNHTRTDQYLMNHPVTDEQVCAATAALGLTLDLSDDTVAGHSARRRTTLLVALLEALVVRWQLDQDLRDPSDERIRHATARQAQSCLGGRTDAVAAAMRRIQTVTGLVASLSHSPSSPASDAGDGPSASGPVPSDYARVPSGDDAGGESAQAGPVAALRHLLSAVNLLLATTVALDSPPDPRRDLMRGPDTAPPGASPAQPGPAERARLDAEFDDIMTMLAEADGPTLAEFDDVAARAAADMRRVSDLDTADVDAAPGRPVRLTRPDADRLIVEALGRVDDAVEALRAWHRSGDPR